MKHGSHKPKMMKKPPAPKGNMQIVGQNVTLRDRLPHKGGKRKR